MIMLETINVIKELGITVVVILFLLWLVKYSMTKMVASLDKLVNNMKVFTDRVRDDHKAAAEQHRALMKEHEALSVQNAEVLNGLRSLNGKK